MKLEIKSAAGNNFPGYFPVPFVEDNERLSDFNFSVSDKDNTTVIRVSFEVAISQKQQVFIEIEDKSFKQTSRPHLVTEENPQDKEPEVVLSSDSSDNSEETVEYVTLKEFAALQGVGLNAVRYWINKSLLKTACQQDGTWYVDIKDTPNCVRRKRNNNEKSIKELQATSYFAAQKWLSENTYYTKELCEYIRTSKEAHFYHENRYREVVLCGASALIINIEPDYYCKSKKMTNRQLIETGNAPVVPYYEDEVFHLHHIGQKKESPLAIIRSKVHLASSMSAAFHPRKVAEEDLHGHEFEEQKKNFWQAYLAEFDKHGGYKKIPHLNSKKKYEQRQKSKLFEVNEIESK